jgi:beta-glucosidase
VKALRSLTLILCVGAAPTQADTDIEREVTALLERMTVSEKIGQMTQVNGLDGTLTAERRAAIEAGRIGSVLNEVDLETVNELQRIAVEESRLGVPLLIGRDVIHGFKTVLPIPLGQAATWNPELVRRGARIAALEAAASGVNWTFAPMIDIARDPRWGRIAESPGEDPYLTSVLGVAMIRGFQTDDLASPGAIAACAKHFAGYGASEGGRDYNTANIPENELRNVYLRPFHAAVDAGVATVMASFSDLNGVPASGNAFLMQQVLRDEWGFRGFVVSDWASIEQLTVHGFTADAREAALTAFDAGVNMEMASTTYTDHLPALIDAGRVPIAQLDQRVAEILRLKYRLGLFEHSRTDPRAYPPIANQEHLRLAQELAVQSLVLLQNRGDVLPLAKDSLRSLAVIGPMADDAYEQLGTWIFDGDPTISRTPLQAIRELVGNDVRLQYARAMPTTRSRSTAGFVAALAAARESDAVVLFLGEESILSGEAHSRADIRLPGNQLDLVRQVRAAGKPVIAVILAGRPLALLDIVDEVDAILYAWHPGTMGGPAIADVLFGVESPSGKLPVTFPREVGQIPLYYASKNTGKPATRESVVHIDDIPVRAPQTSFGMTSFYLDAGYEPLFPFGFGLSYATFVYSDIAVSKAILRPDATVEISANLTNRGPRAADEIVQLYVRDLVGNVTRPVRELKGFERVRLEPGESRRVSFELAPADLAFYDQKMRLISEPGDFDAWIGGSSAATLRVGFRLDAE